MTFKLIKPVRFSLQLRPGASRHLYVHQIKRMIQDNKTLHPGMAKTLKMLRKARKSFIELAPLKEIIIDGMNYCHYERSVAKKDTEGKLTEGRHTGWLKTYWCKEERVSFDKDAKVHIGNILQEMQDLGYEFFDKKVIDIEDTKGSEYMAYLESQTTHCKPLDDEEEDEEEEEEIKEEEKNVN